MSTIQETRQNIGSVWPPDESLDEKHRLEQLEGSLPRIEGDFAGKDIIAISQFGPADIDLVFTEAAEALRLERADEHVANLRGKRIGRMFFEASTRTDVSYQAAAVSAGAEIKGFRSTEGMSTGKGETDEDTVETYDQYFHLLVMRHPDAVFVPQMAAQTTHPIHNGGNGSWEHPSQALLDGFTILQRKGHLDGLNYTFWGDLLKGRTAHSLVQLLAMKGAESINLVSPEQLQMPAEVVSKLGRLGITPNVVTDIKEVIEDTDVLYRMRTQKNRFSDEEFALLAPSVGMVTPELLETARPDLSILHPRPEDKNNPDFHPDVRRDLRYDVLFQTHMGLFVRRALLGLTLDRPLLG